MKFLKVLPIALAMVFSSSMLFSGVATAASCEVQYTRTACPGKEKISYKKCKGKQSCSKFKEAATVEECRAIATKSCSNKRLSITKSKVINAVFDGKAIQTESGKDDFCLEYENAATEFNKCG